MEPPIRPRRVTLVSSSYHPHFGGVEEHVRHVARRLHDRGHDVEVWTVDRGERLGIQVIDGIHVRYLQTPLPARRLESTTRFLIRMPNALLGWLNAARAFRPEILHVHCFAPSGIYASVLSRVLRTPLIVSSHGETFMDAGGAFQRSALLRKGLRAACVQAAVVTGCSALVVEDLQNEFGVGEMVVVPNGVEIVEPEEPCSDGRREPPTVVAVGRLVEVKGFDLLIRAFAQVGVKDSLLVLVGDGPQRESLEELTAELGLGGRVHFLGKQSPEQIQRIMAQGTVVVMPSRREAFGIVALEAWASGTPLIATCLGGPRDFVTNEADGLLVDPEDSPALAAAIERVFHDADFAARLAEAGRASVKQFTWERVVADYERIYQTTLGK
ncbi:glycosyltransferase family 4 protein [Ornithinimicrobium panacihumi]|uniref:glycosyltransferase family 4 protein n=1 Tax=Ornithinimicrobium panacihumi TaxID=2008449 RepID=UPI003F8BD37C